MITKKIKPHTAFANGKRMVATQFNVCSLNDNLFDSVTFKYTLLDEHGVWAGESVYELNGRDQYVTWDATAQNAYEIVAAGLKLEFEPVVGADFFEM